MVSDTARSMNVYWSSSSCRSSVLTFTVGDSGPVRQGKTNGSSWRSPGSPTSAPGSSAKYVVATSDQFCAPGGSRPRSISAARRLTLMPRVHLFRTTKDAFGVVTESKTAARRHREVPASWVRGNLFSM